MNRKTVYMVVGLIVVALAALGVGYGLWFEDLKIHGDVTTGELDVELSGPYVDRYFADENGDVICDEIPDNEVPDCADEKFASVTCTATQPFNSTEPALPEMPAAVGEDLDRINIEVTGAYPSFHCEVTFDIDNVGSVPVHLALYTDPDNAWNPGLACGWEIDGPFDFTLGPDGVLMDEDDPVQLHTDDMIYCNALVHFTNQDGLAEGAGPFTFQYHIRAFQWNEGPDLNTYPFEPVVLPAEG